MIVCSNFTSYFHMIIIVLSFGLKLSIIILMTNIINTHMIVKASVMPAF